jgi:imidazole glycerol-phosphate synthase subunit HisF
VIAKRIIPCLDVKEGRTVKGVNFLNLQDAGDPVELANGYSKNGADELVFLDISATEENRKTLIGLVKSIAREISIPFTIGGGISEISDAYNLLNAGADKISINSAAVKNPALIDEMASLFGNQFIVVAVDTRNLGGKEFVYIGGGKVPTQIHTKDWIAEVESRGAGEVLLTSMDLDGTKNGYDLNFLKTINKSIGIPIIASGGAGNAQHFLDLFEETGVDAALASSIFHFGEVEIRTLKNFLQEKNILIRGLSPS